MSLTLLVFFTLWTQPCEPIFTPSVVMADDAWEYRIHSAFACGQLYQIVESVYLPHGATLNVVPMIDGERVWNAPNPWLPVEP